MTTIRLIDARRGLRQQCESLFNDKRVAGEIYLYLCDGLEECDAVEPERNKGVWRLKPNIYGVAYCSECDYELHTDNTNYCPNCGADMRGERNE